MGMFEEYLEMGMLCLHLIMCYTALITLI